MSSYNSIEVRKSLRLLKKMSCPGCDKCGWLIDFIKEDMCNLDPQDYAGEIKDGAIYTFKVYSSQGYYDLYPEIDGCEFVEVKEGSDEKSS